MTKPIVTSSWDDGQMADIRLSELLLERGIRATFYVPLAFEGRPAGMSQHLRTLASHGFEIGAHGATHQPLASLSPKQVRSEVRDSKSALELALGCPVRTFCYPKGSYNSVVRREVEEAGYLGARTTRMLCSGIRSPFEMPTTVQAYPHGMFAYLKNLCKGRNFAALANYARMGPGACGWVDLGKRLFDNTVQNGGIWHLYGHSWEIDRLSLWSELEQLLDYVGGRNEVIYATNAEAISAWVAEREAGP